MNPIVIHTHLHKRRTGVTRSIENVLPFLGKAVETYVFGHHIEGEMISKRKLKEFLFSGQKICVHCHRNNEILRMLLYRWLGAKFHLIATRHSATKPSWLTRLLLQKADTVISLVQSVHEALDMSNVCIPHGVNTVQFSPNDQVTLPEITQKNVILNTGRIRERKGQKTLLEACSILKNHPDWALVMVGKVDNDGFYKELRSKISGMQIDKQVYFVPETQEIVPYYQAASIFVAPSFSEGFALVTAEAMACECLVLATKGVGVHSEMIAHGVNGYLFEPGNSEELKSLLEAGILGQYADAGAKARQEIMAHWSARLEAQRLIDLYRKAVKL